MKKTKEKPNKIIISGLIIFLFLILIPNGISLYNRKTSIKVNNTSHEYYNEANNLYKDSKEKIKNICNLDSKEGYTLKNEYKNKKDSTLIYDIVCKHIGDALLYSKYEVLEQKDIINNNDYKDYYAYYAELNNYNDSNIPYAAFQSILNNSNHEIILNYLESLQKLTNNDNLRSVNCKKINAKKEMLNNYNLKLKYETEELRFIKNTISYFESYLNS